MTSIRKKTARMVLGSLALLLVLGLADPTSGRLMPSILEHFTGLLRATGLADAKSVPPDQEVSSVIVAFNRILSRAYLELDTSALMGVLIDDRLRRNYVEEINFLRHRGRALELTVQDIRIRRLRSLDESRYSVDTVESVGVRYLKAAGRAEIVAYPETIYAMNYTLENTRSGWKIIGVETLEQGRRNE